MKQNVTVQPQCFTTEWRERGRERENNLNERSGKKKKEWGEKMSHNEGEEEEGGRAGRTSVIC